MQGLHDYDAAAALREVQATIHAINGDLFPTRLWSNRKFAPRFDAEIMTGVGHFPMLEAPREFDRLQDAVLAGFPRERPPR